MERTEAERAVRHGSVAGFVSAGLTFAVGVIAILVDIDAEALATSGLDGWLVVDAVIVAGLAFGLRRGSLLAAITMLVYFIGAKVSIALSTGRIPGLAVALIFIWYFAKAAQGAFVLRRIRLAEEPERPRSRTGVAVASAVGAALLVALVVFGTMIESGAVPDTLVVDGDGLNPAVSEFLLERGLIEADEEILLYYSTALFSFTVEGNVLTDRRALSYEELEGSLWHASLLYEDIAAVEIEDPGGMLLDATIAVYPDSGEGFRLYVSTEGGGFERFLDTLEARRADARGR